MIERYSQYYHTSVGIWAETFLPFFNLLLGWPKANFGTLQGSSLNHPMLIKAPFLVRFKGHLEPHDEFGSQSCAEYISDFRKEPA